MWSGDGHKQILNRTFKAETNPSTSAPSESLRLCLIQSTKLNLSTRIVTSCCPKDTVYQALFPYLYLQGKMGNEMSSNLTLSQRYKLPRFITLSSSPREDGKQDVIQQRIYALSKHFAVPADIKLHHILHLSSDLWKSVITSRRDQIIPTLFMISSQNKFSSKVFLLYPTVTATKQPRSFPQGGERPGQGGAGPAPAPGREPRWQGLPHRPAEPARPGPPLTWSSALTRSPGTPISRQISSRPEGSTSSMAQRGRAGPGRAGTAGSGGSFPEGRSAPPRGPDRAWGGRGAPAPSHGHSSPPLKVTRALIGSFSDRSEDLRQIRTAAPWGGGACSLRWRWGPPVVRVPSPGEVWGCAERGPGEGAPRPNGQLIFSPSQPRADFPAGLGPGEAEVPQDCPVAGASGRWVKSWPGVLISGAVACCLLQVTQQGYVTATE